ncbi:MAG: DUF2461 domain-containing protein [Oscillospiraceae bacterium]|nr:DUF2461 domain-containing protein [Oscillospiraceae bacterium]
MFEGFSSKTVDFLWGIRFNNNREWFLEHKKDYVENLYEPMKALGQELFQPFLDKPGNLLKVSRIYRDARMHHPVPYKESLWICIRQDVEWWAENPCLYFEITPDGISYGFFLWKPRTATLAAWRQDWAAHPKKFLKLIRDTEKATGLPITAQLYKRPPQEAPSKELAPYFAWKGCIGCAVEEAFSEATFGPELVHRVRDLFQKLMPLYDCFNQFKV